MGSGLGLSIVNDLVNLHGGSIAVVSKLEYPNAPLHIYDNVFTIKLPLRR